MIRKSLERYKTWAAGSLYKNEPDAQIVFIGFVRPPLAIFLDKVGVFFLTEWKWIISFFMGLLGLIIAYQKL